MSDINDWQAAQHADELNRFLEVVHALEVAEKSGTPHEVVLLLANECGAGDFYRKHYKEAQ
jgi:hypothetical protein